MREHADTSKLDAIEQTVEQLERKQPEAITDIDNGQLEHAQAVCRQVIDNWDLDEPLRMRAALLYTRATSVKVDVIMARDCRPRLCKSCARGHRVPCASCTCGESVTVRMPGHLTKGIAL